MATGAAPGHFRLLFFSSAAAFTQKSYEDIKAPLALQDLFPWMESKYPGIIRDVLVSCAVTVNLEYVDINAEGKTSIGPGEEAIEASTLIKEGDEVAIIPPVSSG